MKELTIKEIDSEFHLVYVCEDDFFGFADRNSEIPNFRKYPLQPPADASRPRRCDAC